MEAKIEGLLQVVPMVEVLVAPIVHLDYQATEVEAVDILHSLLEEPL